MDFREIAGPPSTTASTVTVRAARSFMVGVCMQACSACRFGTITRLGLVVLFATFPYPLQADINDILEAIRQSEFRFARATSEVPFYPVGWFQYRYYPATEFRDEQGVQPAADVAEHTISFGAVLPVYVDRRDMVLLGGDVARDAIQVKSGPYQDQRIIRLTPVAVWLHQIDKDDMLGVFAAPILSKEMVSDQPWNTNGFGGVIGMHWHSDTLQWLYGGVYEYNFGGSYLYPYLGLQWQPTSQWSVALLFPWPSISYTPAPRWLLQLGVAPGGSSWVSQGDGFENTQTFSAWNLSAGIAYRLQGPWWLYAGAGATGFRGLTQKMPGSESRFEAQSSPVYTLSIQFRP